MRVLVAEDEARVTMLIEDELEGAGYDIVGPFLTCAAALDWLEQDTPDMAVLDYGFRDGPCTQVAEKLTSRGVPILVLSGHIKETFPNVIRASRQIAKPFSLEMLGKALAEMRDWIASRAGKESPGEAAGA
jgi:DNA-binding response OmpR family regulator